MLTLACVNLDGAGSDSVDSSSLDHREAGLYSPKWLREGDQAHLLVGTWM